MSAVLHNEITKLLHDEIVPVIGCTGPTAYALAAAACRKYVTGSIREYRVYVSPAYLKMGFGVATPGTSEKGIEIATAAGFIGGNPDLGMQVLSHLSEEELQTASKLKDNGLISVLCASDETGIYVRNEIVTECETVVSVVKHTHDGLSLIEVNGKPVLQKDLSGEDERLEDHPDRLSLEDIFSYIEKCSLEEVGFLLDYYQVSLLIAEDGIRSSFGMKSGRALLKKSMNGMETPPDLFEHPLNYLPDSLQERIKILVCGASDARMGGSRLPAIAAMGDGNQGLTLMLPIGTAADVMQASDLKKARAMALGALMLFYVKMHTGRAAAMCLCAIAASAGAAAGYGYLRDLSEDQIKASVKNVISPLAGMLCDGAKNACALKMSIAAESALQAADLAAEGVEADVYDGVCQDSLEDTVMTITQIANDSMLMMDNYMVKAILDKNK